MEHKTLTGYTRTEVRKGAVGRLRKMGKIPAIMYGDKEPLPLSVDEKEFEAKFHKISENEIIELSLGDKTHDVLVKDFQEDILKGQILHIDFFEVTKGKTLRTRIPIVLTGTAPGVRDGGILEHQLHELVVECLPKDIPDKFVVDVSGLAMNESIHVQQIPVMPGVRVLTAADDVVVVVVPPKVEAKAEVPAEEAVEAAAAEKPAEGEKQPEKAAEKTEKE